MNRSLAYFSAIFDFSFLVFCCCLASNALLARAVAQEGRDIAKKAARENRKTVEAIHSFSCKSDIVVVDAMGKTHPDQKEIKSGRYWAKGDTVRFAADSANDLRWECLETDGMRKILSTKKGPDGEFIYAGTISKAIHLICFGADIERRCLFRFENRAPINSPMNASAGGAAPIPVRKNLLLDELFDEGWREFKEGKVQGDGTILLVFDVMKRYRHEFTVDPRRNHLVTKYAVTPYGFSRDSPRSIVAEVKEFHEVSPGIFIPKKISEVLEFNGKREKEETTVLSQISVNQNEIAKNLKVEFPPGTMVTDALRNKRGRVRSDGTIEDVGEISKPRNQK